MTHLHSRGLSHSRGNRWALGEDPGCVPHPRRVQGTHLGCGRPRGGSRCSCGPGPGSGSGRSSGFWAGAWPRRTLRGGGREEPVSTSGQGRCDTPPAFAFGRIITFKIEGPETMSLGGRNCNYAAPVSIPPRPGGDPGPEATPPHLRPQPVPTAEPPSTCHRGGARDGDLGLSGLQVGGDVAHDEVHGLDQAQHQAGVLETTRREPLRRPRAESRDRCTNPANQAPARSAGVGPKEERLLGCPGLTRFTTVHVLWQSLGLRRSSTSCLGGGAPRLQPARNIPLETVNPGGLCLFKKNLFLGRIATILNS